MKKGIVFLGSGFELVGMVLAGLFIGSKLDEHFNKSGVFVGITIMVFMAVWLFHFIYLLNRFMKEVDNDTDDEA